MMAREQVSPRELTQEPRLELARLYREYGAFINLLLRRLLGPGGDTEDLTQEVFMVALRKLPSLQLEGSAPRVWLAGIAVRLAANLRRSHGFWRILTGQGLLLETPLVDWNTPEHSAQKSEATRQLQALLDTLPEKKRTVFILFELYEMNCTEIASALGCPAKTIHSRLLSARKALVRRHKAAQARRSIR